jgi:hypothetical protein
MRVKVGAMACLVAVGSACGIALDDDALRVEFIRDWRSLAELEPALEGPDPVYVEVDDWQVLAIDDELRLPLTREIMAERARPIRSALEQASLTHTLRVTFRLETTLMPNADPRPRIAPNLVDRNQNCWAPTPAPTSPENASRIRLRPKSR